MIVKVYWTTNYNDWQWRFCILMCRLYNLSNKLGQWFSTYIVQSTEHQNQFFCRKSLYNTVCAFLHWMQFPFWSWLMSARMQCWNENEHSILVDCNRKKWWIVGFNKLILFGCNKFNFIFCATSNWMASIRCETFWLNLLSELHYMYRMNSISTCAHFYAFELYH